ncbi:MAG: hypothetical protein IKO41_16510 [Lachnospiraceae bacterium]|nr:hypothetical protein [Lachnospiraceae bacterium]
MLNGFTIDQIIKERMVAQNLLQKNIAEGAGFAEGTLTYKLKNQAFTVKDLERVAGAMDCDLEIRLLPRTGRSARR